MVRVAEGGTYQQADSEQDPAAGAWVDGHLTTTPGGAKKVRACTGQTEGGAKWRMQCFENKDVDIMEGW